MSRFLRLTAATLLAFAVATPPALSSQPGPVHEPFVQVDPKRLTGADRELLRTLEMNRVKSSANDLLVLLDRLEKEAAPTAAQKIIISSYRSYALLARREPDRAIAVARNTVAQFPDEEISHAALADVAFFADRYELTAEALIEAVKRDPGLTNRISSYDQTFLFDRLKELDREDLSLALARQMFDAGWTSGGMTLRSLLASKLVASLIEKGDHVAARRYAMEVWSPQTLADILSEHRYGPVQESMTTWAGARLEKQWPAYLNQARASFRASTTPMAAWEYAGALSLAEHNRAILSQVLPVAAASFKSSKDEVWLFSLVSSASALGRLNRWEEAVKVLQDAASVAPDDSSIRINLSGNIARLRLMKGDFSEASALFAKVLEDARSNKFVNRATMAGLESYRVCAEHHNGRAVEGEANRLSAEWSPKQPAAMARMWLCLGKPKQAKKSWLAAAGHPDGPYDLLTFMQPVSGPSFPSVFARNLYEEGEQLRRDPQLRRMAEQVGAIRSWSLTSSAPSE